MNAGRAAPSLAIVIPTANRAELAIAACESLVQQTGCDFHVFVSDNSTEPEQQQRLAEGCAAFDAARVTYLRPPEPLRMATHWDWALRQAMQRSAASHFCIHYDRKITKPGHLRLLADVAAAFPDDLITTMIDSVVNLGGKSRPAHTQWDGRVYAVPTAHIVDMTVKGAITELGQAFPWLSNCTVPRAGLERIAARFGSICDSTTPDSCFAYRFCATHDRFLHFDRAIGILYGYNRSIGIGYLRGSGGDFDRFMQLWGERPWLDAAPIPGLTLGQNILFHEYELVRRAAKDPRFKAVEMDGYLRELAGALCWIEDPQRAAEIGAVLRAHGWKGGSAAAPGSNGAPRVRDGLPWLRALVRDLRSQSSLQALWSVDFSQEQPRRKRVLLDAVRAADAAYRRVRAAKRRLFGQRRAEEVRRQISNLEFDTDREAIRCLLDTPAPRSETNALGWMRHSADDVTPASLSAGTAA